MLVVSRSIAEICRRQVIINDLSVRAIVEGNRSKALQSIILDPMVDDIHIANKLLEEYLKTFKNYLKFQLD